VPVPEPAEVVPETNGLHAIRSPLVGTFYRAPAPGEESYVEVGDTVKAGQVLCIVEAMKMMNEIVADVSGEVVEVLAENSGGVEYDQPLFRLRPDAS
jgi:acetyl-CoA carboxylase biotin carboxyl carrier protein